MTGIQWTNKTWNPIVGCTPVSPGCLNCYAAKDAVRLEAIGVKQYQPRHVPAVLGTPYDSYTEAKTVRIVEKRAGRAVFTGDVRLVPDRLTEPLKWRKPAMCFVGSMADVFHESVPFDYIDQIMAVIALCRKITFQLPTKRPERMAAYLTSRRIGTDEWTDNIADQVAKLGTFSPAAFDAAEQYAGSGVLPNLWLGTSVEDQKVADERIPHLLNCPAAVRFLSAEPLLEDVNLKLESDALVDLLDLDPQRSQWTRGRYPFPALAPDKRTKRAHLLDWVIVGGESGAKARPCNVAWIREIVRQCKDSEVPVFVKQLGAYILCDNQHIADWEDQTDGAAYTRYNPDAQVFQGDIERVYVGDAKGGNIDEFPEDLRVREWPKAHAQADA